MTSAPATLPNDRRRGTFLRGSLRHRLALTLAALCALPLAALGLVYGLTEQMIEKRALHHEMDAELRSLIDRDERGESSPLLSTTLRHYRPGEAPKELATLPPNEFRRLRLGPTMVQALAMRDRDGGTHILLQDLSLMEQRERSLLISLVAGVVISALGAWWISGKLTARILSPLMRLVEEIRRVNAHEPSLSTVNRIDDEELDAIPDAINALIEELNHVLKRERAFADAASHELRTPLAVVRGAIDLLRERGDSPAHVIDRMDRAARRAEEDLRALLALSPAREPAPPRLSDLRELLPATAEPYLREAQSGAQVVWELAEPCEALIEPATLAIVFTNLLRNALRAAPRGEIRIRADGAHLEIIDDGEGLPEGWPATGEPRGRGLGLSLAGILAERHRWRLEVTRAQPRGTRAALFFAPDGVLRSDRASGTR